ncbi:hypothetical protein TNCV_568231 [Trichonephila clavipes]|nr:hypothetical protein TNCV_568231 [Trichonephila clavipes]
MYGEDTEYLKCTAGKGQSLSAVEEIQHLIPKIKVPPCVLIVIDNYNETFCQIPNRHSIFCDWPKDSSMSCSCSGISMSSSIISSRLWESSNS